MHATTIPDHVLAEMPPPFFPDDVQSCVPVRSFTPTSVAAVPFDVPTADGKVRKALRIARAASGETELRLLAETSSDGRALYLIADTVMAPYQVKVESLTSPRAKKPLTEKEAHAEFERRVQQKYPVEVLRNKKTVAIHHDVL